MKHLRYAGTHAGEEVDPMERLYSWAIPNDEVERHKKNMVVFYTPKWTKFVRALRRISSLLLCGLSFVLPFSVVMLFLFSALGGAVLVGLHGMYLIVCLALSWALSLSTYVWSCE